MKRYIPILALLLASQLYPQSKIDINNLIERDSLLYAPNDNKPYTGSVFSFYENGKEELNGRFRNGIKNGKWKWWNDDGGIDSTGNYKNGIMHGRWQFYFSNPLMSLLEKNFQGNMNGMGQYKDGNGTDRGNTGIPRHGRHGKWTFWYESGVLKEKQNWKNGKVYGLNTVWYENGQKWSEGTYKDGKLDGKWTGWYDNGQKSYEVTYKDGKLDGLWTICYKNGQKKSEGTFKDGKKDGLFTGWNENGQKLYEETYKDGELISKECWDEDGNECECSEYGSCK